MSPKLEAIFGGNAVRGISLLICCLLTAFGCHHLNVVLYMDDVKLFYGVSQVQITALMGMSLLGVFCGLPVGYYMRAVGPTYTMVTALVLTTGSCLLLFSSTFSPSFYKKNFWLIIIYSFILGISSLLMLLFPASIAILNFCHRHTGKVSGLTVGFAGTGAFLYALLYGKYFAANADIRSFWLMQAGIYFSINLLGVIFVRDYSHLIKPCDTELSPLTSSSSTTALTSNDTKENSQEEISGLALFKHLNFYLLGGAFLCNSAVQNLIRMNTTFILVSVNQVHLKDDLLMSAPIISAVVKVVLGVVSDKLIHILPRSFFLAIFSWCEVIILFVSIRLASNAVVSVSLILSCYLVDSVYICLYFAVISEMFGKRTVGLNMGLLLLGYGMVGIPIFLGFGWLYDRKTSAANGFCYGVDCFSTMFLSCAITLMVNALLMSWFCVREWKWRMKKE